MRVTLKRRKRSTVSVRTKYFYDYIDTPSKAKNESRKKPKNIMHTTKKNQWQSVSRR